MSQALRDQNCRPLGAEHRLGEAQLAELLPQVPLWSVLDGQLQRSFVLNNFDETMAFVNAVAWIARRQDHHPDLAVGYARCEIHFHTHSAGGLTVNDFICAAHINALLP